MRFISCSLAFVAMINPATALAQVSVATDLVLDPDRLGVPRSCILDGPLATDLIKELRPRIEQAAGVKFVSPPRVRLASPTEFAEALGTKFVNDAPTEKEANPERAARSARAWSRAMAPLLFGFHSRVGDTVFLNPTHAFDLVQAAGGTEQDCQAVIQLVLTHELAHALQNQHVDLVAARSSCSSYEEFERFSSRVEGHANSIQASVAQQLAVAPHTLEMSRRIIVGAVGGGRVEDRLEAILEGQFMIIERFASLVDATAARCGHAAVWKTLATPCDELSLLDLCASGDRRCVACDPSPTPASPSP